VAEEGFDTSELKVLMADVNRFGEDTSRIARELTFRWTEKLRDEIRRRASGRPGPRRITGKYIRSWHTDNRKGFGYRAGYSASVVSAAPQAYRLEYGFSAMDSIGRIYHQPPFPHVRPAVDAIVPMWQQAMSDEVTGWWT
jgi:hypothetical protein